MTGVGYSHRKGYKRVHKGDRGTNDRRTPRYQQGPGHRPRVSRGGIMGAGHGGGSRHAMRGVETSSEG